MEERGFGLVEVLLSAALLMAMIAGTAQLVMTSLRAKGGADFAYAAARQAALLLERDKALAFDSPELEPGTAGGAAVEDGAFPGRLEAERGVEAVHENLKRITVVVSDRDAPRRKQAYCLLVCRGLGF